ncbi:mycothiol transferase [Frigoribacterium sp. 2-23]|uniref:mycothiol transferase n=1 Tax=Frigoribacterium sp. 2-23 TaxID=3415006 RepID=UPI003C6EAD23
MTPSDLLIDAFGRLPGTAARAMHGLDIDDLTWRPDPEANTIAWLVWHTARGQDLQIADLAATDQVWTTGGWHERFDLPFSAAEIGYGMSPADVGSVRASADLLSGYLDAVTLRTRGYLEGLDEASLTDIVDDAWDPPVTAGARLISIVGDCTQHVGQASYVRGLFDRR